MVAGWVFQNRKMQSKNTILKATPDTEPAMLSLSSDQLQRLHFLQMVVDGFISLREAAEKMGVCYRQAKRLKKSFLTEGTRSVLHGNAGRRSHRALGDHVRIRIGHLARTRYGALNDSQITKTLEHEHGIKLSRETVRRLLRAENIGSYSAARLRRAPKPSYCTSEGMMVLWGEITRHWFGAQESCFMAAVDVATLQCLAARFVPAVSSDGYVFLLREILKTKGVPLYVCQHRVKTSRCRDSISAESTTSGVLERILETLDVNFLYETNRRLTSIRKLFQSYLFEQIEMRSIKSIEKANLLIAHGLMAGFNREYACEPQNPQPVWRVVPAEFRLEHMRPEPTVCEPHLAIIKRKRSEIQPVIPCR
jgi:transposase